MFSIGDRVKYEINEHSRTPRVDIGYDRGSSGEFEVGEVIRVNGAMFTVDTSQVPWNFTYNDSHMPGFPVLVEAGETTKSKQKEAHKLDAWLKG